MSKNLKFIFLISFFFIWYNAAFTQIPLYTGVLVSDVGINNSIGNSNTSRNVAIDNNNNIYVVYSCNLGIRVAKSINRGESFLPSILVSPNITEPEIAVNAAGEIFVVWNSGGIKVSKSIDGGTTFSTPNTIGTGSSTPRITTFGANVYIVDQAGNKVFYNTTNGNGTFSLTTLPSSYVYADIRVNENGIVYVPSDNPNLYLQKSVNNAQAFNAVTITPPGSVYYSSYTLSDGPLGSFIFTGGGQNASVLDRTRGYKINLATGASTQILLGENFTPQNRTLFADEFGDLVDGYKNATGGLMINVSYDQGQTFNSPILVENGLSHNIERNQVFEDIDVVYSKNNQIYFAVYPGLLKRIEMSPITNLVFCPGNSINISYTLIGTFAADNVFNVYLSDATGNFTNATIIGTLTSNVAGTIACTIPANTPAGAGYRIRIQSTNTALTSKNNGADLTVGTPNAVVSVNIASDANSICNGTPITFTATPVNGGNQPVYQWKVNGNNVGTNSSTFNYTPLNADVVTCLLTSNATCLTINTALSNSITMLVNSTSIPTNTITIVSGNLPLCVGNSVTLRATPTNGGSMPSFQWKVNGINAGTNSTDFTFIPVDGDVVTCSLVSNQTCVSTVPVVSNPIPLTVSLGGVTSTTISIVAGSQTCEGAPVTFKSITVNGGTPIFQWKKNGVNVGLNSDIFTDNLLNGDVVSCTVTSSLSCVTSQISNSNIITMNLQPAQNAQIQITASSNTICGSNPVNFNATINNGGINPAYQWKVNATNVGINSSIFSYVPSTGDVVSCELTVNGNCYLINPVISNNILLVDPPASIPSVTINTVKPVICIGDSIVLSALALNVGVNIQYNWQLNGLNVGLNNSNLTLYNPSDNDSVICTVNSINSCGLHITAQSNQFKISVSPNPIIILDRIKIIPEGGTVQLFPLINQPIKTYFWSPPNGLDNVTIATPSASPITNTLYKLKVTNIFGCNSSEEVEVKVVDKPKIANSFSPNGDGIHDYWVIERLEAYPNSKVQVFSRTGQLVFNSVGYKTNWDGTYKGKKLTSDTYYYIIEFNNYSKIPPLTGYITLIR